MQFSQVQRITGTAQFATAGNGFGYSDRHGGVVTKNTTDPIHFRRLSDLRGRNGILGRSIGRSSLVLPLETETAIRRVSTGLGRFQKSPPSDFFHSMICVTSKAMGRTPDYRLRSEGADSHLYIGARTTGGTKAQKTLEPASSTFGGGPGWGDPGGKALFLYGNNAFRGSSWKHLDLIGGRPQRIFFVWTQ